MPIPDDRLPQLDDEEVVESATPPAMLEEEDELEFESADADTTDDEIIQNEETEEPDTASFGFGDPAD